MRHLLLIGSIVLVNLIPGSARAVEVYFNGVRVSGLKNQSFRNCGVRFDASGNVYITAKGYTVKRKEQSGSSGTVSATTPSTAKQYYIYSRSSRPGYAQYDVDIYLNGKWVRKVRNRDSQVVVDITRKLKPGKNIVHFAATKNYDGKPRRSTSASDYLQVFIGIGNKGGGTVNITSTLAEFKATASTTKNFGQEQTITVK
jgi:hypothetical protein